MPRSPTMTMSLSPNVSADRSTASGERGRVGGVAGEDPHRDRPALRVGDQPVLDLLLAPLAVTGVPAGGQLAVAPFHPRAGQVEHAIPPSAQMPARPAASRCRPAAPSQSIARVDVVGGGPGHAQVRRRGSSAHQPRWPAWTPGAPPGRPPAPRPGPAPGRAGPSSAGNPSLRAIAHTAATCPCGSDRSTSRRGRPATTVLPASDCADQLDRLGRQLRQVGQGLVADLAVLAQGPAQQVVS